MSESPLYLTENTYVVDPNSDVEMARLILQDRFITQGIGGLFPERKDLTGIHSILDIACGPGGWVLQAAQAYPQVEIMGVDLSIRMIMYARAQAMVHEISNARFRLMNVLKPLDFPDGSFDMVNARTLFAFMSPTSWPILLRECFRILRPGGVIRLTECEFPLTTGPAVEAINALTTQTFHLTGRSFSPDGRNIGITPMLGRLLHDAGYQNIQHQSHVLNYSKGTEAHEYFFSDYRTSFQIGQDFLIKNGLISQEAFEPLYRQALQEIWADNFQAIQLFLTAWGERS